VSCIRLTRGATLLAACRTNEAIREWRSGLASGPVYQFHWSLWRALHTKGNDQETLGELIALSNASGHSDEAQALQQGGGYREAMRRVAALRESQAKTRRPLDPASACRIDRDRHLARRPLRQ
jgi:hypothetical protein